MLKEILLNTPASSPILETPRMTPSAKPTPSEVSTRSLRGRKKVKRDRTKLYKK